ncbi:MAG: DNA-directed RNA polymerase subunit omega [Planctomycetota bacterium]|nr:DNA-directed RNA polymerase subunit omega [Planctomycetaceae bacterium]MDQ3329703.1 DNA-directed RNA polymerase subunit omega [Planctomycetota bacterium]
MLDAFKEERIVNKVGGRFKLSALIQKRMVALNRGARPLVELQTKNLMEVVVAEILQDKIYLDASGTLRERAVASVFDGGPSPEDAGPSLEDL